MRPAHEANVTVETSAMGAPDLETPLSAGVWTLAGDRLIIVDPGGPATITVPTEQVRLLAVDLPLATRAKRLAALPFAIEDLIAEPISSVHLALGEEIAPKRYLVGVVRHEIMARWVEIAEAAGLGNAAIVPDALALPFADDEDWSAQITGNRVVVRTGEGGFAGPVALLRAAWEQAPHKSDLDIVIVGDDPPAGALPDGWKVDARGFDPVGTAERLAHAPLDLRQGLYARRAAAGSNLWRRLGWIVALGAAAHIVIATADTLMLRSIADRRAAETRALVATVAPGATIGTDLVGEVSDMLPSGATGRPDIFLPLLTRLSGALAPLAGSLTVRAVNFQASTLTIDAEGGDPGLATRVDAALKASRISGTVTNATDGSIRITASGA